MEKKLNGHNFESALAMNWKVVAHDAVITNMPSSGSDGQRAARYGH